MPTLLRPSPGRITNPYSASHRGIDFGHGNGTTVVAAHEGVVQVDWSPGYGVRVSVVGDGYVTRYAHLSSATTAGFVRQGEKVGVQGSTGYFAEFVHLHFEFLQRVGSGLAKVNPTGMLTTKPAGTPGKPIVKEGDMIVITDGKRAALTDFRNFQTLSAAEIPVAATIHGSITVSAAGYDVEAARAGRAAVQERQAAANVVVTSLPESVPVELSPAQIAAIGAGVKVDTTSLVDAIRQVPTTAANKIIAWLSRP